MTNTEIKTVCKSLRRLPLWDLYRTNQAAHAAGDRSLASATVAELRRRGR